MTCYRPLRGWSRGDKGYSRPHFKADCEALGIDWQTDPRAPEYEGTPAPLGLKLLQRIRKRIETVIGQLEQRFGLANAQARDAWHLTHPVTRKLLAHTVGVWLNLERGREPLQLDDLIIT
ncbi:MAG: hypothetical protein U1F42_09770 [Candidatus Competibacteraceae bacterium]